MLLHFHALVVTTGGQPSTNCERNDQHRSIRFSQLSFARLSRLSSHLIVPETSTSLRQNQSYCTLHAVSVGAPSSGPSKLTTALPARLANLPRVFRRAKTSFFCPPSTNYRDSSHRTAPFRVRLRIASFLRHVRHLPTTLAPPLEIVDSHTKLRRGPPSSTTYPPGQGRSAPHRM